MSELPEMRAYYTHEDSVLTGHLYYFAPSWRHPGPYTRQIETTAIVDVAADGTLAGVELLDVGLPPPRQLPRVDPEFTGGRLRQLVLDLQGAVGQNAAGLTPLGMAVIALSQDASDREKAAND